MRIRCVALTLAVVLTVPAGAQRRPIEPERPNHTKMRAYNVGVTAFFSVFSAMRQGQIRSGPEFWRAFWRHLLIGSGAGAAFYESKRLAGDGKVTAGWLLANATATIVENTASGEHPIGRIGYTVGPLRLRVKTPYVRKGVGKIDVDWSVAETIFLGYALRESDHVGLRSGLIATDRNTPWEDDGRLYGGTTYGVFPGVTPAAPDTTWYHEVVHAVQHQQMDSVEAPVWTFGREREPGEERPLFAFRHVRLGYTHALNNVTHQRPYQERWLEVEAYWLSEGTPVQ